MHSSATSRLPLAVVLYLALHALLALCSAHFARLGLVQHLLYLDSTWYNHIALNGYSPLPGEPPEHSQSAYAFYPLWPLVLRLSHRLAPWAVVPVLGSVLATLLTLFAFGSIMRLAWRSEAKLGMLPRTPLGFLFFLFSPGAWVFLTNHTEAMFLGFSWLSLWVAYEAEPKHAWRSVLLASALAGCAALTRNQGILLALTTGAMLATTLGSNLRTRLTYFAASGLISGSLFALWPLYLWRETGDPLLMVAVQKNWYIVGSLHDYFENMLWLSDTTLPHSLIFWASVGVGLYLLSRPGRVRPLGVYVLLSALLLPMQGFNLPQAYRFSAVLFPLWFVLGDAVDGVCARLGQKLRFARVVPIAVMLVWTMIVSGHYFFRVNWPY